MTVVRLDAGRDAVRAYVEEQAAQGLAHVTTLVSNDTDSIFAAVKELSEDEGNRVTKEGEWTPAQVLAHLNSSLERSKSRLASMSSGREWVNPPLPSRQSGDGEESFEYLRSQYIDGMQAILQVLKAADEAQGRELTADHVEYGPFTWLQWAVYSHHVHTSDHIGQLNEARTRIRGEG